MSASVQRRYPVRYWTSMFYFVGLPNFLHFDPTGRTHSYGLFNLTSMTDIGTTLMVGSVLVILTALSREGLVTRKINFDAGIWVVLLIDLTLATLLEPASKIGPPKTTDILLSLYRLGQSVLGVFLILSLYSREEPREAPRLLTKLVAWMCWGTLIQIWLMVPLAPSLAFASEDAPVASIPRLGGVAIHPSMVALAASIAFLHSMLMLKGLRRVICCAVALLSLALTYTRAAQILFLIALLIYALFISRSKALRWVGIGTLLLGIVGGVALHSLLGEYLSRGQSQKDVDSLGGRSAVWAAGMEVFYKRPFLGYGFISGPKHALHDVWHEAHWNPPHAHNEFIQALMSGGVLTGALITWLYVYVLWMGCRRARSSVDATFFFLIFVQLFMGGIESTNLTTGFGKPAIFFVMAYLVLVSEFKAKRFMPVRVQAPLPPVREEVAA